MTQANLNLETGPRATMNGKPVFEVPAKSVVNFQSGFGHKLLCDSLTFSAGSACSYSCTFCYVPDLMRKSPHLKDIPLPHDQVVIRRRGVLDALRAQLTDRYGKPKFLDPADRRVIYASPLVDVAANVELVEETIECCRVILDLTHWTIRLLSKSNLLPMVARALDKNHDRVIYGLSTGTLDDKLARAFEQGTPLVSKRLAALHWLQDNGFRTFGMICPSLPQRDYGSFARDMYQAIRAEKCEHVWAEIMNVRGESMVRTARALREGGYDWEAGELERVARDKRAWEEYSRETFQAHARQFIGRGPEKLRFLQYVTADSRAWWEERRSEGAVVL